MRYGSVGEMELGAAWYFYKHRRLLTETEQAQLLSDWKRLQEENAPLRAMVDGKVQSVPVDFYDEAILSGITEAEMPRCARRRPRDRGAGQENRQPRGRYVDFLPHPARWCRR